MRRRNLLPGWILTGTAAVLLIVLPLWLADAFIGAVFAPPAVRPVSGMIDLSSALNNASTRSAPTVAPDFDRQHHGYLNTELVAHSFVRGRVVTVNGLVFRWPHPNPSGYDNVVAAGQALTLSVPLMGATLGVLGAADGGLATGNGMIKYSDGSTQTFTLVQSDWTLSGGAAVVSTMDRVAARVACGAAPACAVPRAYIFYQGIALKRASPISSIILPRTSSSERLHVFALSVGRAINGSNPPVPAPAPPRGQWWGINLSGAEFGDHAEPGVYGLDYTFPTRQEVGYFSHKGLRTLRIPVRWERLQDGLKGPLDPANLTRLDGLVAAAAANGAKVIIDVHNYGRYVRNGTSYLVGSPQVPQAALVDLWSKLAAHYAGRPGVFGYDLMNEPSAPTWPQDAQAVIDGIRRVDRTSQIIVEGDVVGQPPNFVVTDPAARLLYSIHEYFDRISNGFYGAGASYDAGAVYPTIGVDRAQNVVAWLRAHHARAFYGEYGVPKTDPRWLTVLNLFLRYLSAHSNVIAGGTYWSAGPRWGGYSLSVEPSGLGRAAPTDAIQMQVLRHYPTTAR